MAFGLCTVYESDRVDRGKADKPSSTEAGCGHAEVLSVVTSVTAVWKM